MELSSDLFKRIMGETRGQEQPHDERRRRPRINGCSDVMVYPLRGGTIEPAMPVGVRDISVMGVCILQYRLLENNQKFILELKTQDEQMVRILCVVKYWRSVNDELYAMGAVFDSMWTGAVTPGAMEEAA
ncbi:MAG: hypothetical protein IT446_00120 [Phycisphaerales bacterium]|nr:hypothetical protein [Phycisphaerales bacterium]